MCLCDVQIGRYGFHVYGESQIGWYPSEEQALTVARLLNARGGRVYYYVEPALRNPLKPENEQ